MAKEETNKPFNVRFKPSYMDNIEKIISLTNKKKSEVMNEILASYFEGRILTNDFIPLEKPFYFDMKELKEKGIVKAITKPSIHNAPNYYTVFKVPNNIDSFNNELKTYYSGTVNNHKGIYVYFNVTTAEEGKDRIFSKVVKDISESYFIFEYDSSAKALEVSLVPFKDLYLYVPTGSTVLDRIEKEKDEFYNNIILDEELNLLNEVELILKTTDVIQSYKTVKHMEIYRESEGYKDLLRRIEELEEKEKELGIYNDSEELLSGAEHKQKYKELKEFEEKHKEYFEEYEAKHNG